MFVEDVRQCHRQGDLRGPARRGMDLGRVAPQHGGLDRSLQGGVGLEAHRSVGEGHELLREHGDGEITTRAHVVGLAGGAVLHEQAIGAHDVTDIGDVSARGEVADGNDLVAVAFVVGDRARDD
jgi:hypothetical protein